jgi:hypothetical protein
MDIKAKYVFKYDEKTLKKNYDNFLSRLQEDFSGERLDALMAMYETDHIRENYMIAPASGMIYFHNCYIGGLIDHVENVVRNAKALYSFYKKSGGTIDFELEELVFAAYHHDLGKIEDGYGNAHYEINQDDWSIKKNQQYFNTNKKRMISDIEANSFQILNKFGIKYTQKEHIGIICADGLYSEDAKKFLMPKSFGEESQLKTRLPIILHSADNFAAKIEGDEYYRFIGETKSTLQSKLFDE